MLGSSDGHMEKLILSHTHILNLRNMKIKRADLWISALSIKQFSK
jgi:hypothetical protein